MSRLALISRACLAFALAGPAAAALPDGISGPWFNPEQSGHGLSISLVDGGTRAAVIWHVYDNAGEPLTLYVEGVVEGREIRGVVYAPIGMRFAEFDPDSLALPVWGEVTMRFDSCAEGTLSWTSSTQGFSDGSIPIVPLAPIAALPCSLPPPNDLPPGLYRGSLRDGQIVEEAWGIVDGEGRLWGGTLYRGQQVWQPPSFLYKAKVSLAEVTAVDGGRLEARLLGGNGGLRQLSVAEGEGNGGAAAHLEFAASGDADAQTWELGAPAGTSLVLPVTLERLAGEYALPYLTPPLGFYVEGTLSIVPDGEICVRFRPEEGPACDRSGSLRVAEGELGLIDYVLRSPGSAGSADRGRGWLALVDGVESLTLIGSDGEVGDYLLARRR